MPLQDSRKCICASIGDGLHPLVIVSLRCGSSSVSLQGPYCVIENGRHATLYTAG
jgi:hypothetical protein